MPIDMVVIKTPLTQILSSSSESVLIDFVSASYFIRNSSVWWEINRNKSIRGGERDVLDHAGNYFFKTHVSTVVLGFDVPQRQVDSVQHLHKSLGGAVEKNFIELDRYGSHRFLCSCGVIKGSRS